MRKLISLAVLGLMLSGIAIANGPDPVPVPCTPNVPPGKGCPSGGGGGGGWVIVIPGFGVIVLK